MPYITVGVRSWPCSILFQLICESLPLRIRRC